MHAPKPPIGKTEEYTTYLAEAAAECQKLLTQFLEKNADKKLHALEDAEPSLMQSMPLSAARSMMDVWARVMANPHKFSQLQAQ